MQFLADTFNALFSIMEEMAEEVGELVFEALVRNVGLSECVALLEDSYVLGSKLEVVVIVHTCIYCIHVSTAPI